MTHGPISQPETVHDEAEPLGDVGITATLPVGWVRTTLGDLVTLRYGKGLTKQHRDPTGCFPVYGSNGVVGFHAGALTAVPSVVIGRKGAAGQIHLSNGPCWPIDTTYYVEEVDGLNLGFLYYLLSTLRLSSLDKSTAIPGLNRDDAYASVVPLAPLTEQRRIVAKIDELFTKLDAGVASLKRAQANLKRYRASVLKTACEGRLVPQDPSDEPASELLKRILAERRAKWELCELTKLRAKALTPRDDKWRQRYTEPIQPEIGALPELPNGWTWTAIGVPFEVSTGGTPSRSKAEYWDGTIPWVSSGEVANCRIITTRERITNAGLGNSNAKLHPPGTILLAMIGEGKTRGQVALLATSATTNQNVASISCQDTPILPEYLFYCLMARYRENRGRGSGGMQPALNAERVRALIMPVCPVAEQERIVFEVERLLSVTEALENTIKQGLHRSDRLRQSILKAAFEGKLVPQHPNDEPAEILLERIKREKAERATKAIPKTPRRAKGKRTDAKQLELV